MQVRGCFWHGHNCVRGDRPPKANAEYWRGKIGRNRTRDAAHLIELKRSGWRSAVVWECELKNPERVGKKLARFLG